MFDLNLRNLLEGIKNQILQLKTSFNGFNIVTELNLPMAANQNTSEYHIRFPLRYKNWNSFTLEYLLSAFWLPKANYGQLMRWQPHSLSVTELYFIWSEGGAS